MVSFGANFVAIPDKPSNNQTQRKWNQIATLSFKNISWTDCIAVDIGFYFGAAAIGGAFAAIDARHLET